MHGIAGIESWRGGGGGWGLTNGTEMSGNWP